MERSAGPSTGAVRPSAAVHDGAIPVRVAHCVPAAAALASCVTRTSCESQSTLRCTSRQQHSRTCAQAWFAPRCATRQLRHQHEDASPARASKQILPAALQQEAASCARRSLQSHQSISTGKQALHVQALHMHCRRSSPAAPPQEAAGVAHACLQITPAELLPEGAEPAPTCHRVSPQRHAAGEVTGTLRASLQAPSTAPLQADVDVVHKFAQLKLAASPRGTAGAARASPQLSPEVIIEGRRCPAPRLAARPTRSATHTELPTMRVCRGKLHQMQPSWKVLLALRACRGSSHPQHRCKQPQTLQNPLRGSRQQRRCSKQRITLPQDRCCTRQPRLRQKLLALPNHRRNHNLTQTRTTARLSAAQHHPPALLHPAVSGLVRLRKSSPQLRMRSKTTRRCGSALRHPATCRLVTKIDRAALSQARVFSPAAASRSATVRTRQ